MDRAEAGGGMKKARFGEEGGRVCEEVKDEREWEMTGCYAGASKWRLNNPFKLILH